MRLVVNTNRIMAALIKDSIARKILKSDKLDLLSINFGRKELEKHKEEILEKASINDVELNDLLNILFRNITMLDDSILDAKIEEAKTIMDKVDPHDTPFIAAALASNCDIWSDDEHFQKQDKVKVWKTKDIIGFI